MINPSHSIIRNHTNKRPGCSDPVPPHRYGLVPTFLANHTIEFKIEFFFFLETEWVFADFSNSLFRPTPTNVTCILSLTKQIVVYFKSRLVFSDLFSFPRQSPEKQRNEKLKNKQSNPTFLLALRRNQKTSKKVLNHNSGLMLTAKASVLLVFVFQIQTTAIPLTNYGCDCQDSETIS